jgi:20S proteasome alpha/beta subunit
MLEILCSLQAATAGAKDQEAVNFLEKKIKGAEPLPYAEAVQLAIGALQNVLSEDFKATDIEVLFQHLTACAGLQQVGLQSQNFNSRRPLYGSACCLPVVQPCKM